MANFFESGFTVLQELAKLKQKEKKDKILAEAKKVKKKAISMIAFISYGRYKI